jgi:hypothetical protein
MISPRSGQYGSAEFIAHGRAGVDLGVRVRFRHPVERSRVALAPFLENA